jgi:asparagine synthase (glutamine-hydrolysing)
MSELHGVVRSDGTNHPTLDDWVPTTVGTQYATDSMALLTAPSVHRSSSKTTETDLPVRCWVLGDVYGYDPSAIDGSGASGRSGAYEPRPADTDPARYCAALYDRHGLEFLRGLNGNFTLVIHDPVGDRLHLCTDRFGTVPLYWARPDAETVVLSANIQLVPAHPEVDTAFDPGYLHEYLAFRRTFGVTTPFEGIEKLEPGTVTTISLADGELTTEQYWRPQHRPREESFEWFVDEFATRFQTIVDEWTRDDREYGVLLSGGSDSRLVLAALDDAVGFHMNDWMNREARTAERVAFEADAEFELLERGAQYRIDALERNRWASSFNGWFTQPYTSGFETRITERVDGLLSGLYADSLFGGFSIPSPRVSLGPLGSVRAPVERPVDSLDDYIDLLLEEAHDGLEMPTDLRSVLEANIYRDGDQIVHHGVTYDSLDELVYFGDCYPLSNDDDLRFHTHLRRACPSRSPFLDNRLLDLSLSMPVRYRLRRDLVNRAVDRLDPDLASIPHASTGVALSRPFPVAYAAEHVRECWDKHVVKRTPPEPYLTDGPWLDDAELLRADAFALDALEANAAAADALPGPDADAIRDLYAAHCDGANHVVELYTLLTVLTMPVTAHVLDGGPEPAGVESPQPAVDHASRRALDAD